MEKIKQLLKEWKIIYNKEKRQITLQKHGVDLEIVKQKLKDGKDILLIEQNPKPEYSHQFVAIIAYDFNGQTYPVVCPFKINKEQQDIKIITAYPSRKFKYLLF